MHLDTFWRFSQNRERNLPNSAIELLLFQRRTRMEVEATRSVTWLVVLVAFYLALNSSLNLLVSQLRLKWVVATGPFWSQAPQSTCSSTKAYQVALPCPPPKQNKWALGVYGFRFPFLLTSTHMAFSFLALAPVALLQPWEVHVRTLKKQWRGIVYIGGFMALNIALNNISLLDIRSVV